MVDEYKLVGFLNVFGIIPDFVYPVFEKNNIYYYQDGTKTAIKRFIPIKNNDISRISFFKEFQQLNFEAPSFVVKLNSPPLDAFQPNSDTIVCGTAPYLSEYLSTYNTDNKVLANEIESLINESSANKIVPVSYNNKQTYYGTGRRKKAVARVYISPGSGKIIINKRDFKEYFDLSTQNMVVQPLILTNTLNKFDVVCSVNGGGFSGQAGAISHGISRALLEFGEENLRGILKSAGLLTRDPRMKERKKYGLKKARKAPQFSKR